MASLEDYSVKDGTEENSKYMMVVQKLVEKVDSIITTDFDESAVSYVEKNDDKLLHTKYYEIVNRNSYIISLLRDVEFYKHKFKKAKKRVSESAYYNKLNVQIGNLLMDLDRCSDVLGLEREKLDRVLRFYERAYNRF